MECPARPHTRSAAHGPPSDRALCSATSADTIGPGHPVPGAPAGSRSPSTREPARHERHAPATITLPERTLPNMRARNSGAPTGSEATSHDASTPSLALGREGGMSWGAPGTTVDADGPATSPLLRRRRVRTRLCYDLRVRRRPRISATRARAEGRGAELPRSQTPRPPGRAGAAGTAGRGASGGPEPGERWRRASRSPHLLVTPQRRSLCRSEPCPMCALDDAGSAMCPSRRPGHKSSGCRVFALRSPSESVSTGTRNR